VNRKRHNPNETGHQAISNIETFLDGDRLAYRITMSAQELFAVLYCAAAHAQDERMYGTADRLFNDADAVRELSKSGPVTININ
jgi:hypothetical protein